LSNVLLSGDHLTSVLLSFAEDVEEPEVEAAAEAEAAAENN
jgi:hypothetical protein